MSFGAELLIQADYENLITPAGISFFRKKIMDGDKIAFYIEVYMYDFSKIKNHRGAEFQFEVCCHFELWPEEYVDIGFLVKEEDTVKELEKKALHIWRKLEASHYFK